MKKYVLFFASETPVPRLFRFALPLIFVILMVIGCKSETNVPGNEDSNTETNLSDSNISLLLSTPLVGDETTVRIPAPLPVRALLNLETVGGWLVPPEKILRFAVDLKTGNKLSFRLGIIPGPYVSPFAEPPQPGLTIPPTGPTPPGPTPPGPIPHGPTPPGPAQPAPQEQTPELPANLSTTLPEPGDLFLRVEFVPTTADGRPAGNPSVLYEASPEDMDTATREWVLVDLSLDSIAPASGEIRLIVDGPRAGSTEYQVIWGQPSVYTPREESFRNVLLIGIDTLRADAISPLGGRPEATPNIQAFSEEATVFTQAHSQAPWTLPSFASMVTSLMPSKAVEAEMGQFITEGKTTIGEYLLREGLATNTVCSSPWLGIPRSGFQQGMEGFSFYPTPNAQIQVEAAKNFITRSHDMGRDWFCFIHLMDAHTPYQPPESYSSLMCNTGYTGQYATSFPEGVWSNGDIIPSQEEIDHVRCLYDCEVANVDSALQGLFELLDEKGITEDTLIIFTADHGEAFGEHDSFEHGRTQYEELVHVPLIVRGPGFPAGSRIDQPVANLDILPTVFRYMDLAQPASFQGIPLQDTVSGEAADNRIILGDKTRDEGAGLVYALNWPYKCILDYKTEESVLYNLEDDPGETIDVSAEYPEIKASLLAALSTLIRPETSSIHVWVTGYENHDHKFMGTIRVPGGIENIRTHLFSPGDTYTVNGDTVEFSISSLVNQRLTPDTLIPRGVNFIPAPVKHLVITLSAESDGVEVSITVDNGISSDRFFPFGTRTADSSGSATLKFDDFPMVPTIPTPGDYSLDSFILWGVRGTQDEEPPVELDPETLEQLRALGYVN